MPAMLWLLGEPRSGCPEGADHPSALYIPPRAVGADSAAVGPAYGVAAGAPSLLPPRPPPGAPASSLTTPLLDPASAAAAVGAGLLLSADPALGPGVAVLSHPASGYRVAFAPGPSRGAAPGEVAVVPLAPGGLAPHLPSFLAGEVSFSAASMPSAIAKLVAAVAAFDAAHKVA